MPLYMDRHDTPEATPEEVAQAHLADIAVAPKHNVQFLSYWFDAETEGVFCLAKAPEEEALMAVHQESHGLLPNEIISVSENDVLRFLGGIQEPADASEQSSPFRAILFTDLEGSTALLNQIGESTFMELLGEHDALIRRALLHSSGREVKHTGDGILASFDEVADALSCSLEIQKGFRGRADAGHPHPMRVRVGMAAGEPVDHNDDIFGSVVNLASRICDAADAGQTLVSDVVQDVGSKGGFQFETAESLTLKGFSDPTPVFRLIEQQP
ncbi:MAG: nickel-binding protein [Acidimicrobiia bacterium]